MERRGLLRTRCFFVQCIILKSFFYIGSFNCLQASIIRAPLISTHPTNVAVLAGQPASFSVVASGTEPLGYQWRKGGVSLAGATNSTYVVASANAGHEGVYDVVVSNASGWVVSTGGNLSVTEIISQPQVVSVGPGMGARFSVGVSGTQALSYQWRKNGVALTSSSRLVGATERSLAILGVEAGDEGSYDVVISSALGTRTSQAATLTVRAGTPVVILESGLNLTVSGSQGNRLLQTGSFGLLKSTVEGLVSTNLVGVAFYTPPSLTLRPVLPTAGGSYHLEVTSGLRPDGSVPEPGDLVMGISQSGCSGLPPITTAFRLADPNRWRTVGTLTLDPGVTNPTITMSYASGFSSTAAEAYWIFDAVRFVPADVDTNPPVITLIGTDLLEIYKEATFIDPGATVTDNKDSTRTITGSGTVNTATVGIYTLTYTATDAAGNLALPVTRTVNVVLDPAGDEDGDGLTNGTEISGGTNPYQKDSDSDGVTDGREVADGTNPTNANSYNNLSRNLVAYYPFNGNANDESGNGNHGTVTGATLTNSQAGRTASAYRFDGTNARIVTKNIPVFSNSVTASAWVRPESVAAWGTILDSRTGVNAGVGLEINNAVSFTTSGGSSYSLLYSTSNLTVGSWVHVTAV
ncbi:MAG: hypothetical protein RLZZ112_447, partial [Verrucomicrobiota bacterium]